mmetsp:Transcript_127827/g.238987  ORF Transcript_127827/g.238987 Transcript_127827/m.238987 type:complete len:370 (+) Transcript_127827:80-1189(+)
MFEHMAFRGHVMQELGHLGKMCDDIAEISWSPGFSARSTEFPDDAWSASSRSRCASEPPGSSRPQSPRKVLLERPELHLADNVQIVPYGVHRTAQPQLSDIALSRQPSARPDFGTALQRLDLGRKRAAAKLGSSHATVEHARLQQRLLRQRGKELRWQKLEAWHESNIARAASEVSQGADPAELEFAVRLARDSELGHGHRLVAGGQAHLSRWRKRRHHEAVARLEDHHASQLAVAAQHGELHSWEEAIRTAAVALGSAHPIVEEAREAWKRHRWQQQHMKSLALIEEHKCLIFHALASEDVTVMSNVIQASARVLGHGHPVVVQGKQSLLELRKQLQREREADLRQRCSLMLEGLVFEAEQALAPMYF